MKISDILGMCAKNLWRRKMRTLLTVLGVVIGSCAIIVMISLGLGSNAALKMSLERMGDLNVITVMGVQSGGGGMVHYSSDGESNEPSAKLNKENVEILKEIKGISSVFPTLTLSAENVSIKAGKNYRYAASWIEVVGINMKDMDKFGFKIGEGELKPDANGNYMVFGYDAAYNFGDTKKRTNNYVWREQLPDGTFKQPFFNPLESDVLLSVSNSNKPAEDGFSRYQSGGRSYEHKMRPTAIIERNEEQYNYEASYCVLVNIEFAEQLLSDYNRLNAVKDKDITYTSLKVRVDNLDDMDEVEEQIKALGFQTYSMNSFRNEMQGQLAKQQMLLGGLAAISLFVAAVGIANTMIMSIYERTREIGVMKVLGCFIGDIRKVFLLEAGCIGMLGGIMGTLISFAISIILNIAGGQAIGLDSWMAEGTEKVPLSIIPPWLVIVALVFSTLIGVISGFYPANRAVKISALEAIKND